MYKVKFSKNIGVIGVLQIIFVVLKCIGAINWSWGIVLIPAWIKIAVFLFCIGFTAIYEFLFWR